MVQDIRDWNKSVADWDKHRWWDYLDWVKQTYGNDELVKGFIHIDDYRAVKDVMDSVEEKPQIDSFTSSLAKSMQNTKEVMAANLMKKMWGEKDESCT